MRKNIEDRLNSDETGFGFDTISKRLAEMADDVSIDGDIYSYSIEGEVVAEIMEIDNHGYLSVIMDKTGEYAEEIREIVSSYEDIEYSKGQVLDFET